MAAALSEAAGFAGWLHADMCDRGTARSYYRMAVSAARRAGHDLLAGYMLGSLAAFEVDNGDPATGLRLAGQAQQQLGNPAIRRHVPGLRRCTRWVMRPEAIVNAADAALGRAGAAIDC